MTKAKGLTVWAVVSLALIGMAGNAQTKMAAKANQVAPASEISNGESDRVRDGLNGAVRRVRTEVVKLSTGSGATQEGKHTLLETAEYDVNGTKTQNQYYPLAGAPTGREVYKYDDKGNISEMSLLSADGSLMNREVYKYEYDSVGNWVKMTTSIVLVASGKIEYEPTEITYRTIFYYLDASAANLLATNNASSSIEPVDVKSNKAANDRMATTIPPPTALAELNVSPLQPVLASFTTTYKTSAATIVAINDGEPPPAVAPKPVSGGVLNGKALSLPPPQYPEIAKRARAAGTVAVEVIVDENGKVVSARAVSGPPSLREVSVEAANRARFSPTKLSGQAIKITGTIEYKFVLP